MEAAAAIVNVERIQQAFRVIGTLMLTAYLLPRQAIVKDFDEYDFIIVGAGSAGSVIADRLSEVPHFNILVIEAGGDPPYESLVPSLFDFLPRTKYDWNFTSFKNETIRKGFKSSFYNTTCAKMLGGGSSINYLYYVRGCPNDYDSWANIFADKSWSYAGVLPYFIKSERLENTEILNSPYRSYHGTTGFLGVTRENRLNIDKYLQAFGELGNDILLDVNGAQCLGFSRSFYTIARGVRQTTAVKNLGANKGRPNLHVLKNTFVTQILIDENNNAIGVKAIIDDNKEITIKATQEVIISAGALNTPKLLMLSGIGQKSHLQKMKIKLKSDLPVGLNLQDHPFLMMPIKLEKPQDEIPPNNPFEYPFPSFVGYVTLDKLKTSADYQATHFLVTNNSVELLSLCVLFGYKDKICQNLYEATKDRKLMFSMLTLLHPKSRGQVLLRSSDPRDSPLVDLGILSDERDIEDFTSYVEDYVRIINTTYFKSISSELVDLKVSECIEFKFGSKDYWRCYVKNMSTTMYHYSGTAAMGFVVDSRLRVFGMNRLRVADASVMPLVIGGNTNAAVIMIGEKLADMVKEEYYNNEYRFPFIWNYFY